VSSIIYFITVGMPQVVDKSTCKVSIENQFSETAQKRHNGGRLPTCRREQCDGKVFRRMRVQVVIARSPRWRQRTYTGVRTTGKTMGNEMSWPVG
jgi:hypothetical protein